VAPRRLVGIRRSRAAFLAFALVLLALEGVFALEMSSPRNRTYRPPDDDIAVPTDAASIARGKHLVEAVAVCTICHGENLGGKLAFEDDFLGRGYTANLTSGRGGIGRAYSNADWVRSIRYGVRPDGRGIIFMPSDYFNQISDADLGAMIAYLRSLPPVDNARTAVEINLPARLLIDLGVFGDVVRAVRIDFRAPRRALPLGPGPYLVALGGCTFCHGPDLTGGQGPEPGAPGGPDLTSAGPLSRWSFVDFVATMRFGLTPDGRTIEPKYMPWLGYRNMTDGELRSIWEYLGSLPSATGGRADGATNLTR
jgi:mono/diheme cytochrome c family protein